MQAKIAAIQPPTKRHFDILFKAGSAWKQAGQFDRAFRDFEEIVRLASRPQDNLRAQLAIGDLWLDSGNPRKSLGSYLRIVHFYDAGNLDVRPWVGRALLKSGLAFEKLGKLDQATTQFKALARDFSGEKEVAPLVEEAKARLGRLRGASEGVSVPPS